MCLNVFGMLSKTFKKKSPVCSAVDLLPYLSILCHVVVHGVVGPLTMGRQEYHHFPVVFGLIGQGWRAWTDRRTWKIDYFYSQQAYSVQQRFLIVLQMQVFYILLHILYVTSLKDVF